MIDSPAHDQPRVPAPHRLPRQSAAIDRSAHLLRMATDIKITEAGEVIQILRYPTFGAYGRDPADPGALGPGTSPFAVSCGALPVHAAAMCAAISCW